MKSFTFCYVLVFLLQWGCVSVDSTLEGRSFGHVAIMQGATSTDQAQFVIAVPRDEEVQIELLDQASEKVLLKVLGRAIEYDHSKWKLLQFRFSELQSGKTYGLRVKGRLGNWVDHREFRTFVSRQEKLKLGIISCMRDDLKGIDKIWRSLRNEQLQALFMIGDNIYADIKVPGMLKKMTSKRLWDRHMETRNRLPVFRWQKLVPIIATWDDHDYGVGNGTRDFHLKEESAKIFSAFFPMSIQGASFSKGEGVARALPIGEHQFLLLDNRSFRAPVGAKTNKVHFGEKQVAWLYDNVSADRLNWVISGDQFFGAYHPYDSFQKQHPQRFSQFLTGLKRKKAAVLFVSGDRHLSEVMRLPSRFLGYQSYELTSSPMHSSVYPGASDKHKNPLGIAQVDGQWNYMTVDLETSNLHYVLSVNVKGSQGQKFFSEKLKIKK